MKITRLKQPRPREKRTSLRPFEFAYTGFLHLPAVLKVEWPKFNRVLTNRRSRRTFELPISFEQLVAVIWHSARLRDENYLEDGTLWQSRIAPSGGGCHPIHIVIIRAPDFLRDVLVYNAEHNGFGVVERANAGVIRKLCTETERCVRIGKGTVLWFVADVAKTAGRYLHPESLVWRDSGALLATVGLVAEALNLECCALGIHETPSLRRALKLPASVVGVGGCVLSGRAPAVPKANR